MLHACRSKRRPGSPGATAIALVFLTLLAGLPLTRTAAMAQTAPESADRRAIVLPDPDRRDSRGAARQVEATTSSGEISIDGALDEDAWRGTPFASDFTQKDPSEGEDASERTEVAFVFDDGNLYIGARMFSDDPSSIQALVSRRDQGGNADQIIISFDSYRDRRTAYTFAITAGGVRRDWYHGSDNEYDRDMTWDPVWVAAARVDEQGWTAEARIPFSQLRFNRGEVQVWGVNIQRKTPSRNEDSYWEMVPKDETGWSSRMGELVGINGANPARRIELLPYVASDALVQGGTIDPSDPFNSRAELDGRVGADAKIGLGPNLTLDATVNPDFGQVEADPAVVNLSQFEVFFPERRPFFLEGQQLLEGDGPNYYYSRRIGGRPHGFATGDYVSSPDNTTIIGAAKVTGRMPSGTSVGLLGALTAREYARWFDATREEFGETQVEPLTGWGVGRLQQEFGANSSTAGLTFTAVNRAFDGAADPLSLQLNQRAFTGGGDWNLRFDGGKYVLNGFFGMSQIAGDSAAIARAQLSSARYYQRPDADYVSFDPGRTSLFGWSGELGFFKRGGEHWLWGAEASAKSPAFEINDLGQMNTADDIDAFGMLRYRETQPGPIFRDYSLGLFTFSRWNFGGVRNFSFLDLETSATWKNFWSTFLSFEYFPRAQSDNQTRGGPLMGSGTFWNANGGVFTNSNVSTQGRSFLSYGRDEFGGWFFSLNFGLSLRPSDRFQLSLDPRYFRQRESRQYVSTVLQSGGADTFGNRYVFSFLDQTTYSAQFRINYSITPDMSIEGYAEPFAASGEYFDHGELPAARSYDIREYGTDGTTIERNDDGNYTVTDGDETFGVPNLDFGVLSFRTNLVLRWEWRPGSTLFLVWQQNKGDLAPAGERVGVGSLWDAMTATGDNFFAVKMTYWLPVG